MAFTVGTTIAQMLTIAKSKPSFGGGGKLDGPSHSQNNGMPVTNPQTGQVQAWLEGDELITNKRTARDRNSYTVSGTPSQIISSLNRMHGGVSWDSSASIQPFWKSRPYRSIDYRGFQKSVNTIQMFESGGVFRAQDINSGNGNQQVIVQSDNELKDILSQLVIFLNNPVQPIVNIPLTKIDDAYDQRTRIINEATP